MAKKTAKGILHEIKEFEKNLPVIKLSEIPPITKKDIEEMAKEMEKVKYPKRSFGIPDDLKLPKKVWKKLTKDEALEWTWKAAGPVVGDCVLYGLDRLKDLQRYREELIKKYS